MPTFIDRALRRLYMGEQRLRLWERVTRIAAVAMMVFTGLFFIIWPPTSTAALWGSDYAPYAWGFFMTLGGVFAVWGLCNRILQVEQTGMFIITLAVAFYVLNQSLIMFAVPITWTRAGSTTILAAFTFFSASRYFALSADILAARSARRMGGR